MDFLIPGTGMLLWTVFMLLILLLPVAALISLLQASFKESTTKLIWVLVVIFMPFAGPILYFVIGRKQRIKTGPDAVIKET
jgi:hypothetical protein